MHSKVLVILSGGQDSTTCLFWAKSKFKEVHAITFNYGQRNSREVESAAKISHLAKVSTHRVVHLPSLLVSTSPLISDEALDRYKYEDEIGKGVQNTFVPMRNQLFITIAANYAFSLGINRVVTGVSQADSGGYPDCREEFINKLQEAITLGTFTPEVGFEDGFFILTPLISLTKEQTVNLAVKLTENGYNAYEGLGYSHTAYDGSYPPIGTDHASILRERGFKKANVPDPLILRAWKEGLIGKLPNTENYVGNLQVYLDWLGM